MLTKYKINGIVIYFVSRLNKCATLRAALNLGSLPAPHIVHTDPIVLVQVRMVDVSTRLVASNGW